MTEGGASLIANSIEEYPEYQVKKISFKACLALESVSPSAYSLTCLNWEQSVIYKR